MQNKTKLTVIIVAVIAAVVGGAFVVTLVLASSGAISEPATSNGSEAKINIDEVCQGALAYMSFPSSVEADAFVQECKDGKHPEVIEKWKHDQGITDDRAI